MIASPPYPSALREKELSKQTKSWVDVRYKIEEQVDFGAQGNAISDIVFQVKSLMDR